MGWPGFLLTGAGELRAVVFTTATGRFGSFWDVSAECQEVRKTPAFAVFYGDSWGFRRLAG